jgi:ethanolamine utilization protein EutN
VLLDCTGAGPGELIYWCRGKESSFPFLPEVVPSDGTIVGFVDELHVQRGR